MRRSAWVLLAAVVTGSVSPAVAQPGPLAPVGGPPQVQPDYDPNLPPEPPRGTVAKSPANRPPNVLGPPVMGSPVGPADRDTQAEPVWGAPAPQRPTAPVVPASAASPAAPSGRRAALGAPVTAGAPVSAQRVEPASRTSYASTDADDAVNDLLTQRSPRRRPAPAGGRDTDVRPVGEGGPDDRPERASGKFGDRIGEALGSCTEWFKSDHAFDGFISPVTNPLLFEDPRALTEVRPIFMYQQIPGSQPDFNGGSVYYYGVQARLAVTDRLSFTFNKLAGITLSPGSASLYDGGTGFGELWLGPKYTFIRNEDTGTLLAGGVQFQIPVGSSNVFQNTGNLSVVPYVTYGQNFGRDFKFGGFNALVGTGYSFSTDDVRSDYYYLSAHLDMDVLNKHKFYPLVELNWLYYTNNGNGLPTGNEGRDLFNLGGQAKNSGLLTGAFGARYKITECAQVGAAFEFPLAGPRDMFQYRVTLDFILRY
ncbi:signal peptide protein : Uncharacterized protein OS=Isosphaera pallida (strain ATCC 43644 / DSM 9630 / IS1B) GN=Isop_1318 PE=4 SV=1 [Gemmataceae bacterium]|nr:signal peptide protein : Uncharacterized protein OS=Isosphaera pallida (strain ATCC 43644 / DSM 9630 / IS1B) GN=Isop_1318 PE=4 SV=1 [Gemmataceae bacterium]VTT98384.1 signal peptide protein : Uncharacterized protein OS=Isosphaera pallida (strain ATCC 43644 / DSM 9630 / IS1B) GN=Isop_1318 PE=4 SV=1 [Gemmataceae bacterium]